MSLSPSLRGHCCLCILSWEGQRAQRQQTEVPGAYGAARAPQPTGSCPRAASDNPRRQQAMKPAPWLRLHPCPGTGIARTEVTAKMARARSSQVASSFLTNSFRVTYVPTSVSLLAAYLPLQPCAPRASRSQHAPAAPSSEQGRGDREQPGSPRGRAPLHPPASLQPSAAAPWRETVE